MDIALVVAALAVGLLAGWLAAQARATRRADDTSDDHARAIESLRANYEARLAELDRERGAAGQSLARVEAERDAGERALQEQQRAFREQREQDEARRKAEKEILQDAFARLSKDALASNTETFLKQANETLEQRRKAVEELLKPFNEQLNKLQLGTQALENKREGAYASLQQQITTLLAATEQVSRTGQTLAVALRGDARARGRWGEMALQNVAELAGMTQHCDFDLQEVQDNRSRPDMIVNLPGGDGRIPVDAKAPMDAYMLAVEATDPDVRKAALMQHAVALKGHVRDVAGRDYSAQLGARVDYTVLFLPAEPILAAAFEADPDVQSFSMQNRVLLATPVTLLALLRTVALYWKQANLARDAQHIAATAREYHDRLQAFMKHMSAVGRSIEAAVAHWNRVVGSYERSILPQGRRLEELQPPADPEKSLPDLPAIDEAPRELPAAKPRELETD